MSTTEQNNISLYYLLVWLLQYLNIHIETYD